MGWFGGVVNEEEQVQVYKVKRSRWKRVVLWSLLGLVIVILAAGGGSYWWFQHQVGQANARVDQSIVDALKEKPKTTTTVASPTTTIAGEPASSQSPVTTVPGETTTTAPFDSPSGMNIVLLGYDKRVEGSSEETEGRSDVIILVHIDPDKGFLSLLSVPRDLRTEVEGYGHRKINAAYAYGGGALLIRTLQDRLGVDLDHYIAVNLEAFKAITNYLGGVYVDVDRPYSDGKIILDPGYQLLDGLNAERFCRTRHDSNIDFGRSARQQRFLSAARMQVMKWNLPLKLPGLIKTIFQYADTDLSANEVLKLAYWVMKVDSSGIKRTQITGPTGAMNGSFYILPTDEAVKETVDDFFTAPTRVAQSPGSPVSVAPATNATLTSTALNGISVDVVNGTGRAGQSAVAALWLERQGASVNDISTAADIASGQAVVKYPGSRQANAQTVAQALGIQRVESSADVDRVTVLLGDAYGVDASQLAGATTTAPRLSVYQALQKKSGIALVAPTYMPADFSYEFDHSYDLDTGDGAKPAVRVGYQYKGKDLDAGISATTWVDAPLAGAGIKIETGGVAYTLVGATNKPDLVWWVKNDVLYWVSNTIMADLSREQMLAIAISTVPVPGD